MATMTVAADDVIIIVVDDDTVVGSGHGGGGGGGDGPGGPFGSRSPAHGAPEMRFRGGRSLPIRLTTGATFCRGLQDSPEKQADLLCPRRHCLFLVKASGRLGESRPEVALGRTILQQSKAVPKAADDGVGDGGGEAVRQG
jgi:hypothetical protein